MAQYDNNGRQYLKLSEAKVCQCIELDDGFTCHPAGQDILLQDREGGRLHFICADGNHYIDGQDDGDGYCVGIYPVE